MQTRFAVFGALVCGGLLGACLVENDPPFEEPSSSGSSGSSGTSGITGTSGTGTGPGGTPSRPPECTVDDECIRKHAGDVDAGADRCVAWECRSGACRSSPVKGTEECQCNTPEDCREWSVGFTKRTCNEIACDDHRCSKSVSPAGPAATEKVGDCAKLTCDGTAEEETRTPDVADLHDDANPCTIDSCSADGKVVHTRVANGTACGDGAICMTGECLPCKPSNPTTCGGEGAGEPINDTSAGALSFAQWKPMCTFGSGTDVDWYTFYAKDADFSTDVFHFDLWSTAPTIELCLFVKCGSGTAGGGCANKLPGPDGSLGCCWIGAPSTLKPVWDMDCSGTTEDSGTTYMSIRTPGATSCERYALYGGY